MSEKQKYRVYFNVVLPSLLTIVLFILSLFLIVIPSFERNMMDGKKEMIDELTNTAWSVLDEYRMKSDSGILSVLEAKQEAASVVELMRYGGEGKDYFWIIDMHPTMIMHPYLPHLNGKDLSTYEDPEGTLLFNEAVEISREAGEGFIYYIWQWKDDSSRMVPKLSHVKSFAEWEWVIGTGIYLDDVEAEMVLIRSKLVKISVLIMLVISVAMFYLVRQSLLIERKRKDAEQRLQLSRKKYKTLVDASREGTLMMLESRIVFANLKFARMLQCEVSELYERSFEDIFEYSWEELKSLFTDPNKSVVLETRLKTSEDVGREVVITVSKVNYDNGDGYIIIGTDVSKKKRIEKGMLELHQDLQMSLTLMNQPVKSYIKEAYYCNVEDSIRDTAKLMSKKLVDAVFVKMGGKVMGIVSVSDFKERVVASGKNIQDNVMGIMTAPVHRIVEDALLYEALLIFNREHISHLLVEDIKGIPLGILSYKDITALQHNSLSFIVREIQAAENMEELVRISNRIPVLVKALLESGDKTQNVTRLITINTDTLTRRVIELSLEKREEAPCNFAFVSLGSEGRGEQTLSTDQDNAIVFDDVSIEKIEEVYLYFRDLAEDINFKLNELGFRYCKGRIMAMNPKWTQPLSIWKEYFSDWINNSDPQSILDSCIFFDFRYIYGDESLIERLSQHVKRSSSHRAVFFQHMANPILNARLKLSPVSGSGETSESEVGRVVDIKKIQFPVVAFARLYALQNRISETNTLKRLEALRMAEVLSDKMYNELAVSYAYLMQLRLRFQVDAVMNSEEVNNLVDLKKLTVIEYTTLKKVLAELSSLQTKVSFDFKGGV